MFHVEHFPAKHTPRTNRRLKSAPGRLTRPRARLRLTPAQVFANFADIMYIGVISDHYGGGQMKEREFKGANTREFYRVEYPMKVRPLIKIGEDELPVIDISEKGGKFQSNPDVKIDPGARVEGTITFHHGESVTVQGEVLRAFNDQVIICFTNGIPFSVILNEQRYLKEKYSHLF
jgi:hypothetical protein